MNNSPLIIVDTDAIVSLSSRNDANYEKAKRILKHLTAVQAAALFPITAICEATTVFQRKLSSPQAASL
jgi:predicted nucleic acid-binding protein